MTESDLVSGRACSLPILCLAVGGLFAEACAPMAQFCCLLADWGR
jgi:hypothetical protein